MADCVPGKDGYIGDCELTQGLRERAEARVKREERGFAWKASLPKAAKVRLFILDVDGVLTDGSITYSDEGLELKTFNSRDGFGLNLVRQAGVEVAIITARTSQALVRRCQDLKIDQLHQGQRNKVAVFEKMIADLGLKPDEVAYMGDDWLDLPLLSRVGFATTVADAVPEMAEAVDYVCRRAGGHGAVREVCDLLVDAKGMYRELLDKYLARGSS
ncbi:MAG: HAD hydrolase family protein [Thermodesulfobacteriota bacterium]